MSAPVLDPAILCELFFQDGFVAQGLPHAAYADTRSLKPGIGNNRAALCFRKLKTCHPSPNANKIKLPP